ncbi:hypothetical protein BJ912DRAFT_924002 [Pholiota molesta]|nr:hypothetical protein BJ912DRAFT_924002 [Pholiota molesta]
MGVRVILKVEPAHAPDRGYGIGEGFASSGQELLYAATDLADAQNAAQTELKYRHSRPSRQQAMEQLLPLEYLGHYGMFDRGRAQRKFPFGDGNRRRRSAAPSVFLSPLISAAKIHSNMRESISGRWFPDAPGICASIGITTFITLRDEMGCRTRAASVNRENDPSSSYRKGRVVTTFGVRGWAPRQPASWIHDRGERRP